MDSDFLHVQILEMISEPFDGNWNFSAFDFKTSFEDLGESAVPGCCHIPVRHSVGHIEVLHSIEDRGAD